MLFKTLFKKIYASEIPVRIEWMFDRGFIWSIIDGTKFPRTIKDDDLNECLKKTVRSEYYSEKMKNPIYEADWIARGSNDDIEDCLCELCDAIVKHYPNSNAAKWIVDFNKNREHFFICAACGDLVDMRDLGNVFEHEHDDDKFPKINSSKIVSQKIGDNKAWNKGKQIDLN